MSISVSNEQELGKAIKNDEIEIEVSSDKLGKQVLKIKATGVVAWAVAIGAIGVAVTAILVAPATGGTSVPVAGLIAAPAVGVLGISAAYSAIAIAVAAGGVGALNKLRNYQVEKRDGKVVLIRK